MHDKYHQIVSKYDEFETKFLSDIYFQIPEDIIIYTQLKYLYIIQKNQYLNIYPYNKLLLIKISNNRNNEDNPNIKWMKNFFFYYIHS